MHAQQVGQRLGDHRAARNERLLALWQRRIDVRNGHTCGAPKGSWRNREVLQFADMQCISANCRRSEEHTSELQSHLNLVCRLLLEKKKKMLTTLGTAQLASHGMFSQMDLL